MLTQQCPNKQYTQENQCLQKGQRAWFNSHLLQHPARKLSGSILTTLEPARGYMTDSRQRCYIVMNPIQTQK